MRVAAHVMLAYAVVLILGAVWPQERAVPDVVALSAVYLGLTARHRVAPSLFGAIAIGYLADILIGSPRGLLALTAGILCFVGHFVQGRLLVRGVMFTFVFSFLIGLLASTLHTTFRLAAGLAGDATTELSGMLIVALLTGIAGPLMFRLYRFVDSRFSRRGSLEGLLL